MNYPEVPGPYQPNWSAQPGRPYPQGYQPQQPYPPGYGQPAEGIAVTTQYYVLGFMLGLFKPKIIVDGQEMPSAGWGRTVLPARAGQHHVHVHVPYWLPPRIGPADAVVDVYPGRLSELEYKAPVWGYSKGSLGYPPQKYKGVGITVALLVISLLLAVVFPLVVALAAR